MFSADTLYTPDDPLMRQIAPMGTLANWRSQGKGPAYVRLGKRVAYRGRDLNDWIEAQTIRPTAA